MSWFDDIKNPKLKKVKKDISKVNLDGVWDKCLSCKEIIEIKKLEENFFVCPYCNYHHRMSADQRMTSLLDPGSFQEFAPRLKSLDPLEFTDRIPYKQKLLSKGHRESSIVGIGEIEGEKAIFAFMDFTYMGGSLGVVTGEKITRAFEKAQEENCPVVIFSSSGGARMHEGILSLMQMAKTTAAREKLKESGTLFISILTDPTTGGVAASYALQGDIILAEPRALIGFAGPRVIQQSIRQTLPEGFQRSEFLLKHGQIDAIIERKDLRSELKFYLSFFSKCSTEKK